MKKSAAFSGRMVQFLFYNHTILNTYNKQTKYFFLVKNILFICFILSYTKISAQCGDAQPPFPSGNLNVNVECANADTAPAMEFQDICDGGPFVGIPLGPAFQIVFGACGELGTWQRQYEFTDADGIVGFGQQNINVIDNTPPIINGIVPLVLECPAGGVPPPAGVTATDNCDPNPVLDAQDVVISVGCSGDITEIERTWTAVDCAGKQSQAVQTIIIEDTQAPTFANVPPAVTISCTDAIPSDPGTVTANDDCEGDVTPNIVFTAGTFVAGTCPQAGTITHTWDVSDCTGNPAQATQIITIEDNTGPTFTVPIDITVECDLLNDLNTTGDVTDEADNCDTAPLDATFTDGAPVPVAGGCPQNVIVTRTWTLTDACGNITSQDQTITLEDTTPPTFTVPANITIECDQDVNDLTITGDATNVLDNCDGAPTISFVDASAPGGCPEESMITRTWTVTDACGNVSPPQDQVITIEDNTDPTFTVPADVTLDCNDDHTDLGLTGDVTDEADNCDTSPLDATFVDAVSPDDPCVGTTTITRTWTLVDACGNDTVQVQTIILEDATPPTFTVPINVIIECDQNPLDLTLTGDVTDEADNCDTSPLDATFVDSAPVVGACPQENTITRTWTLIDACGNTTNQDQIINIIDSTPPTFTVPPAITVECDLLTDLTVTGDVTDQADNCDGAPAVAFVDAPPVPVAGGCPQNITIVRTWTVTDACGNFLDQDQIITLEDTTPPTFTAPANITIECDQDVNDLTITGDVTNVLDNCDGAPTISFVDASAPGACPEESTITRTWTVTDACGNASPPQDQIITIEDNTDPTFTVPADITLDCSDDHTDLALTGDVTDEADNCDTAPLDATFADAVSPDDPCVGATTITRTWTLIDACGNDSIQIQTIVLEDNTAPTFTVPADAIIECNQNPLDLTLTGDVIDEADDCDGSALDATFVDSAPTIGSCPQESTFIRTWTLIDGCGNTTTQAQTIDIIDSTDPTFTVPPNVIIDCHENPTDLTLTGDVTDEADNCDGAPVLSFVDSPPVPGPGNCPFESTITRTWTVTDACGNSTDQNQTVTVSDISMPTFTVPADVTISCEQGITDFGLTGDVTDEADNCDSAPVVNFSDAAPVPAGTCPQEFSVVRTWTVTDACGNFNSQNQLITVVDTTGPIFTVPADIILDCSDNPNDLTVTGDVTDESDNCDSNPIDATFVDVVSPDDPCVGTTTIIRTWTATDNCGNITNLDQIITLQDSTPPTFTVPVDVTLECDQNPLDLILTGDVTDEADNCDTTPLDATFIDGPLTLSTCPQENSFTRTWTLTDACGNTTSLDQIITIEDTTDPTFTVPADITVECDLLTDLTVTGDVTDALDNCDGAPVVSFTDGAPIPVAGGCPQDVTVTRTWTVTDACGNDTIQIQIITLQDTTAPTFTVPADITIECDQDVNDLTITGDVTDEADNCDAPPLDATFTDSAPVVGACPEARTITRTWTLTDACGNTTNQNQIITLQDTTAPTFTVPADITLECDQDVNDLTITGDVTDESDNCDAAPLDATFVDSAPVVGACPQETVITRTWTLTDACGNTTNQDQIITIEDNTDPTFTVPVDVAINCDDDATDLTITGDVTDEADNCDGAPIVNFTDSNPVGDPCLGPTVITRTWTVTDACGNVNSQDQTITVAGDTPPTFTVPADITIECTQNPLDLTLTGDVTDADDTCNPASLVLNFTDSAPTPGSCPQENSFTRTWTVTDACGNVTSQDQIITITDSTPPTFTVPADITLDCDADINDLTVTGNVTDETDNCDGSPVLGFNDSAPVTGTCPNETVITRTWTVVDACGNVNSQDQLITVGDITQPTFTVPADITIECDQGPNDLTLTGTVLDAADNCDNAPVLNFTDAIPIQGSCFNESILIRTWTVTDACGNVNSQDQTITIVDTTGPTFTVPANINVDCQADVMDLTVVGDISNVVDNCDTAPTATFSDVPTAGGCPQETILVRTWIVTDNCGNMATQNQTITITDNLAPTFTAPADITLTCTDNINDLTVTGDATNVTDNCDGTPIVSFTDSPPAAGTCSQSSAIVRTWTVTDDCGNVTTQNQNITIDDSTAPTFTVPADVTIECDDNATDLSLTGDVTNIFDNCDGSPVTSFTDSAKLPAIGNCPLDSILTRTWTVTDACGNTTSQDQIITLTDTTPPTFTVPADIALNCDQNINDVSLTGDVTDAVDNCDPNAPIVNFTDSAPVAGTCPQETIITRTWTATDVCGNATSQDQIITVGDIVRPTFTVPANVTIDCTQNPLDVTLTGDVTDAADSCDNTPTVSFSDLPSGGSCPQETIITRTWTATDACGNATSQDQIITISDTTAPTFTAPADITLTCTDNLNDLTVTGNVTNVTDDCDGSPVVNFIDSPPAAGTCSQSSAITRTWTVTDACGNTTSQTQNITIDDSTAPTFTVPADITVECNTDVNDLSIVGNVSNVLDNCDGSPNSSYQDVVAADPACATANIITRTWTVVDACGNATNQNQIITLEDTTPPTFTVPADIALDCTANINDLVLTGEVTDETDNCDTTTLVVNFVDSAPVAGTCPQETVITRTWTATDACGNVNSQDQTITLSDLTAPTFDVPADTTIECGQDPFDLSLTGDISNLVDNCDTAPTVDIQNLLNFGGNCSGSTLIRTWTVTDACGNSTSQSQSINIIDTTPPVFVNIPADTTLECSVPPLTDAPTVIDNCDVTIQTTFTFSSTQGFCPHYSTVVRTWTATDACGNTSTVSQTVDFQDTTAPTFDVPPHIVIECDDDINDLSLTGNMSNVMDNCDNAPITSYVDVTTTGTGTCAQETVIQRTWIATDACGNSEQLVQFITMADSTPPNFTVPVAITIECTDNINDLNLTGDVTDATDACDGNPVMNFVDSTPVPGTCPQENIITRTWTATDACGNTTSQDQTITMTDSMGPTFDIPADLTIECGQDPFDLTLTGDATNLMDSCDPAPIISIQNSFSFGTDCSGGTLIRTWTATDACGNATSQSQIISIVDTTPPVFANIPADTTIECSDPIPPASPIVSDNCDATIQATFSLSTNTGTCTYNSVVTRTWTATDLCGNTSSITQTITIQDTTPPVFADAAGSLNDTLACYNPIGALSNLVPTVMDNCSNGVDFNGISGEISLSFADDTIPTLGIVCSNIDITRTWTATDVCGNSSTFVQMIVLHDDVPPVFTDFPADDATLKCLPPADEEIISSVDNCIVPVVITHEGDVMQQGTGCPDNPLLVIRTYRATDPCGNFIEEDQLLIVSDDEAPVIIAFPQDMILGCIENLPAPDTTLVTASEENQCIENLSIAHIGDVDNGGSGCISDPLIISRTYRASDACGNFVEQTQTFTIIDETPPTITQFPTDDLALQCITDLPTPDEMLVVAVDDCLGAVNISFEGDVQNQGKGCNGDPLVVTRTYRATDQCGNFVEQQQTFTIQDEILPLFTDSLGILDTVVECSDDTSPLSLGQPTVPNDNCSAVSLTFSDQTIVGVCLDSYTISRTWLAIDSCGNQGTYLQTITVQSTELPIINQPTGSLDITVECDASTDPVDTGAVTATYNCTAPVTAMLHHTDVVVDGSCTGSYTIERTWSASDDCGNISQDFVQLITVQDTSPPVFLDTLGNLDITLECGTSNISPQLLGQPIAIDNCSDNLLLTYNFLDNVVDGGCANSFAINRSWFAIDECGNVSDAYVQVINIVDNTPPTLIAPPSIPIDYGDSTEPTVLGEGTATDNCDGDITIDFVDDFSNFGNCSELSFIVRTWIATDACGNVTEAEQNIVFIDQTPPTIVCPVNQSIEADARCQGLVPDFLPDVILTDNCSDVGTLILSQDPPFNTPISLGNTPITISAIDEAGNEATCVISVDLINSDFCSVPIVDTIYLTTNINEPILNECLPTADLVDTPVSVGSCDGNIVSPEGGGISFNFPNCFNYVPPTNYLGSDTVCMVVCDGSLSQICDRTYVVINIENRPPVVIDDSYVTAPNMPITFNVFDNDQDSNGNVDPDLNVDPSYLNPGNIANGNNTVQDFQYGNLNIDGSGNLVYIPDFGFAGTDTLIYVICDLAIPPLCDTATVTITVPNTGPIATDDNFVTDSNTSVDISTIFDNDSDTDNNLDPDFVDGNNIANGSHVINPPTSGSLTLDSLGNLIYIPDANFSGTDQFTYILCDLSIPPACDTATVTISTSNLPPIAGDNAYTTLPNTSVSLSDIFANDSDADGNLDSTYVNPSSISLITTPNNGTLQVDGTTGELVYIPDPNYAGTDQFIYEVCDLGSPVSCDQATVTITILNEAPTALDDSYTTQPNTPVNVSSIFANDSDPDGNLDPTTVATNTITVTDAPDNGTLTTNSATGELIYTPNTGFTGTDQFVYQICDLANPPLCDEATVTITMENQPPVAIDDSYITPVDVAVTLDIFVNDSDPNNNIDPFYLDPSTMTILNSPSNGSLGVDGITGQLVYTPNAGFVGTDQFDYQICDLGNPPLCDQATVIIEVSSDNIAPVANDDTFGTTPETAIAIAIFGNDSDINNNLDPDYINPTTMTILTNPTNGSLGVDGITGELVYTPNTGFMGTDTFTYEICDLGMPILCDQATVTITVAEINEPPVAMNDSYGTPLETSVVIDIFVNDSDPNNNIDPAYLDPNTLDVLDAPNNGALLVDNTTNELFYTPDNGFVGTDTFVYQICDTGDPVLCDEATVIITVANTNQPPVANDDTYTTDADTSIAIDIFANDGDADGNLDAAYIDPASMVIINPSTNGTLGVDGTTGELVYTPNTGFVGMDQFVYEICDLGNPPLCDQAIVTITINAINLPPVAEDDFYVTPSEVSVVLDIYPNDSDPNGNLDPNFVTPANINLIDNVDNGFLTINSNGDLEYVPNPGFVGTDQFEYEICDLGDPIYCDQATVFIEVGPPNLPPVAENDDYATQAFTSVTLNIFANDSDPDGNLDPAFTTPATIRLIDNVDNGFLTLENGNLVYTPNAGFVGIDQFIYEICDLGDPIYCDQAIVNISVTPPNVPPVAENDDYSTAAETSITLNIFANDSDPDDNIDPSFIDPNTIVIIDNVDNGFLTVNNGDLVYTPNAGFVGIDQFIYEICDLGNPIYCDQAVVNIGVAAPNLPPVAENDDFTTTNGTSIIISSIFANDSDPDGNLDPGTTNPTAVSLLDDVDNGILSVSNGDLVYTPNAGFVGIDQFIYEICDTGNPVYCDQAVVDINVQLGNVAPIAVDDSFNTSENMAVVISSIFANDSDPNGNLDPMFTDFNTMTWLLLPSNGVLTIDAATGDLLYTPDNGFVGTDSMIYEICDTSNPALCNMATIVITVADVNNAPNAVNDTYTTASNTSIVLDIFANDNDPDNNLDLSYTDITNIQFVSSLNNGTLSIDASTNELLYTPNLSFVGTDQFTYEICDTGNPVLCDQATVIITVIQGNHPPIAVNDTVTTLEGIPVTIPAIHNDSDLDGDLDSSSVIVIIPPSALIGLVSADGNGNIIFTPTATYTGTVSFTYRLCDLSGNCTTATITVHVVPNTNPVPPVAINDTTTTPQTFIVTVDVLDNDFDTDGILINHSVTVITPPNNGTTSVNMNTGAITYSPDPAFTGVDQYTYIVCDNHGLCDSAQVVITVGAVSAGLPPTAVNDFATTQQVFIITIDVLANDFDLDGNLVPSTVTVLNQPIDGTASVNTSTGAITYSPDPTFVGVDVFTYLVCDNDGLCDSAQVTVTVVPNNGNSNKSNSTIDIPVELEISQVYPTPSVDFVTIDFNLSQATALQLEVFDLSGRLITQTSLAGQTGFNQHQLDMQTYSSGVYLLLLRDDEQGALAKAKLVKE